MTDGVRPEVVAFMACPGPCFPLIMRRESLGTGNKDIGLKDCMYLTPPMPGRPKIKVEKSGL